MTRVRTRIVLCAVVLFVATLMGAADLEVWTTHGPFGGRIWAFTFHPTNSNIVFVAGDTGIFRSTNGGKHWTRCRIQSPFLFYPIVAIPPLAPNEVFAASRELWKSNNSGKNWALVYDIGTLTNSAASSLQLDPRNPKVLYVAGYQTVWKSQDGGHGWSAVNVPPSKGISIFRVDPQNGSVFYLAEESRLYKSTDAGGRWVQVKKFDSWVMQLLIHPADTSVLYLSDQSHTYRSVNAGYAWTAVVGRDLLGVDPHDARTVFAGNSRIVRSTNGGMSWSAFPFPLSSYYMTTLGIQPRTGEMFLDDFTLGVFASSDSGATWNRQASEINERPVFDVALNAGHPGELYANAGESVKSTNAGLSWSGYPYFALAHPQNGNLLAASGTFLSGSARKGIALSNDGGATWSFKSPYAETSCLAWNPQDQKTLYAGSGKGNFVLSTDGGETWKASSSGLPARRSISHIVVSSQNPLRLYIGITLDSYRSRIFASTNGGASWDACEGLGNFDLMDIDPDPSDASTVYALVSPKTRSGTQLVQSTDTCRTWKTLPLQVPAVYFASSLALWPGSPTVLVLASDRVQISRDLGATWTDLGSFGMRTNERTHDIEVDAANIYVASNHGVFTRSNPLP